MHQPLSAQFAGALGQLSSSLAAKDARNQKAVSTAKGVGGAIGFGLGSMTAWLPTFSTEAATASPAPTCVAALGDTIAEKVAPSMGDTIAPVLDKIGQATPIIGGLVQVGASIYMEKKKEKKAIADREVLLQEVKAAAFEGAQSAFEAVPSPADDPQDEATPDTRIARRQFLEKLEKPSVKLSGAMLKLNEKDLLEEGQKLVDEQGAARHKLHGLVGKKELTPEQQREWKSLVATVRTIVKRYDNEIVPRLNLTKYFKDKIAAELYDDAKQEAIDAKMLVGLAQRMQKRSARGVKRAHELTEAGENNAAANVVDTAAVSEKCVMCGENDPQKSGGLCRWCTPSASGACGSGGGDNQPPKQPPKQDDAPALVPLSGVDSQPPKKDNAPALVPGSSAVEEGILGGGAKEGVGPEHDEEEAGERKMAAGTPPPEQVLVSANAELEELEKKKAELEKETNAKCAALESEDTPAPAEDVAEGMGEDSGDEYAPWEGSCSPDAPPAKKQKRDMMKARFEQKASRIASSLDQIVNALEKLPDLQDVQDDFEWCDRNGVFTRLGKARRLELSKAIVSSKEKIGNFLKDDVPHLKYISQSLAIDLEEGYIPQGK